MQQEKSTLDNNDETHSAAVGKLLLNLIKHELPASINPKILTKYHSYFSRILSSNITPQFSQNEENTRTKMHELVQKMKNAKDKRERSTRLHECLNKLSRVKTLNKRWAVLRAIYSIGKGPMTANSTSGALFTISNIRKREKRDLKETRRMMMEEKQGAENLNLKKRRVEDAQVLLQKSIVRELLFIFQGVESKFFVYSEKEKQFFVDPSLEISLCQRKMIKRLCELGWLYNKIQKFLSLQINTIKGLIFQSLCYSVKNELNEYYKLISIMENLRDSEEGYQLNLKKLFLWTLEPFERLKSIAILTEACENLKGGELLSALYSYSSHGNPQLQELLNRILKETLAPFMNFLKMWVYNGELVDPMCEFFVEQQEEQLPEDKFWYKKFRLRTEMVPSFIDKELARVILVAGKTKIFLRKFCENGDWSLKSEFITVENLISFRYMEGSKFKAFENWVASIKKESDKKLKEVIMNEFHFMDHFRMIKSYLLLSQGDFMNNLMENLQQVLGQTASKIFKHSLLSILETAKSSTSAQNHKEEYLDRVGVRLFPPEPGSIGWDIFSLDYRLDSPLNTIFTKEIMDKYLRIFNFLWRVKKLEFWLNEIWILHKKNCQMRISDEVMECVNACNLIRHQMLHFVKNFFSYLMLEVIETEWNLYLQAIKKSESLDEIIEKHNYFLKNVLDRAILSDKKNPLRRDIMKLLDFIARFKVTQDVIFINLQEHQQREIEIQENKGSFYDDSDEEDYLTEQALDLEKMKEEYKVTFAKTNRLVSEIWENFIKCFEDFLDILRRKNDMKSLAFKLDFNEYYISKKHGGGFGGGGGQGGVSRGYSYEEFMSSRRGTGNMEVEQESRK